MPILRKIYVGPNVYVPVVLCNARRTVYILLLLLVLCLRVLQGHYHDIDGCLCLASGPFVPRHGGWTSVRKSEINDGIYSVREFNTDPGISAPPSGAISTSTSNV